MALFAVSLPLLEMVDRGSVEPTSTVNLPKEQTKLVKDSKPVLGEGGGDRQGGAQRCERSDLAESLGAGGGLMLKQSLQGCEPCPPLSSESH